MTRSSASLDFLARDLAAVAAWLPTLPDDAALQLVHDVCFRDADDRDAFRASADERPDAFESYHEVNPVDDHPEWLAYQEPVPRDLDALTLQVRSMVELAAGHHGDYNSFKVLVVSDDPAFAGGAPASLFDPSLR